MAAQIQPKRKKISTYCYQCVNGPDMLTVEVIDGVASKVEPNFGAKGHHPADGKVCVKPYGLIQKLYNPNRVLKPMKRTNPKKGRHEDPGWVEISWDEALDLVAGKLNSIRERGLKDEQGYPRFAFSTGGAGTPLFYMGTFPAFLAAWGPVEGSLGAGGTVKCYHSEHIYGELWQRGFTIIPDTPHTEYIVSFGRNDDASGGVQGVRRHADARYRGCRRVQIEPHLSVTGASASEWIPIRPKTDSAFMFAMLHVLLHEHAIDKLDVGFLKHRTGCPYLIAPNGYYARDPQTRKPLLWDEKSGRAVAHDTPSTEPVLAGTYTLDCLEVGADGEEWRHKGVQVESAFSKLLHHVARHTPEWAAPICDVPAETIRRIANEFLEHARVGATIEIDGRTLPLRPASISLGKSINNGWGAYECVWARTLLHVLVGALEVPGGSLGNTVLINSPETDRWASVIPGPDGFMAYPCNPTDKENWVSKPEMRHAHRTLTPMVGNALYSAPLGSSTLAWLRMQGGVAEEIWPTPQPPDVWFVYHCNPSISFSETTKLGETMARFPFMVAFAYTEDETNHFADVLLPDAMDLESYQLIRIGGTHYMENFWESEGWVLRQKVVEPRGEAKEFTWFTNELAKRTGLLEQYNTMINYGVCGIPLKTEAYDFSLDPKVPHAEEEVWDAVCRAASFDLTGGKESNGLDWFIEHGFKMRPFPKIKWYLYPRMVELGLRFELPYQERILRIGTELGRRLHETGIHWWDRQLHEYEAMPEWKDINAFWNETLERNYEVKAADYPYWVLTSRTMPYAWGGNVGLQMIKEVSDNIRGHDGIMLNAQTAAKHGIGQGDLVEVSSAVGKTRGQAILRQGIHPEVVLMIAQFGHWKTPFAKDLKRPSLNDLVPMHLDFLDAGGAHVDAAKVNIRRVEG
jgi:phenylacetyl-CoA:acceptor oxidoreductase